ncbi:hypothetical protein REPUB_Repub13aG0045000 [Reevesia pubescens]
MNSCNGVVDNKAIHKLESCLVWIARDYYEPCSLLENFNMSGVFDISVKKMSSKQFLIEFEDVEVRNTMEQLNWSWLREWFVEIKPWIMYAYTKHRTMWVTIFGLPLHVWNHSTLHNIASIWGEVISYDSKTFNYQDFNRATMLIMTNQLKKIEEVIALKCSDETFLVKVSEVEEDIISLFHYCHNTLRGKSMTVKNSEGYNFSADSLARKNCSWEDEQTKWKENKSDMAMSKDLVSETDVSCMERLHISNVLKENNCLALIGSFDGRSDVSENKVWGEVSLIVDDTYSCGPQDEAVRLEKCDLVGIGLDDPELALQLGLDLEKVESQCNVFACLIDVIEEMDMGQDCEAQCNDFLGLDGEAEVVDLGQDCEALAFMDTRVKFFRAGGSVKEKGMKNKRGAKTIVDIEDHIIERMDKKGRMRRRRKKNFFCTIQEQYSGSKIVNSSLSDSDFFLKKAKCALQRSSRYVGYWKKAWIFSNLR